MGNILDRGAEWLTGRLQACASIDILIQDDEMTIEAKATVGKSEYTAEDNNNGVVTTFQSRDYLVPAASLVFSGKQITPRKGMKITEVVSGKVCMILPEQGLNEYRLSDTAGFMLRIHTKQIC